MSDKTLIEWTDATWNPITGCSVHSPGCTNCYAMELAGTRLKNHESRIGLTREVNGNNVWTGTTRFNEQWLYQPLRWSKPRMIFVCAHGDLFHESVPVEWIDRVFAVMALARHHVFQVLTKRSERQRRYVSDPMTPIRIARLLLQWAGEKIVSFAKVFAALIDRDAEREPEQAAWPLPNVWLGVSVEDQTRADERIPDLLATPAAIRWLSCEPLLGPVNFSQIALLGAREGTFLDAFDGYRWAQFDTIEQHQPTGTLDWIVAGGESGANARPMHPDWAIALRDECAAAGVPFLLKQWGEWAPVSEMEEEAIDACYHPAPDRNPEATRRCKVNQCVLHRDGQRFDGFAMFERPAFEQGSGAMTMFAIGKKRAGRLLDGVEHNGYPV